jgi:flagellar hook assembly protein FlgD
MPAPLYFFIDSLLSFKNVFNYPNSFGSETHFTFVLTDYADEVEIKIYMINGRLIQDIQVPPRSNAYYRVYWNGRDHDGDDRANGIYFYKIIAKSNGSATEVIQKLVKVR